VIGRRGEGETKCRRGEETQSGLLKGLPIDAKLADGGPKCAELEILRAPVGKNRGSTRTGVEPLPMGPARTSRQLLATEIPQFPFSLPIIHGRVTTLSNQMGVPSGSWRRFEGTGLFRSSYASRTAANAS